MKKITLLLLLVAGLVTSQAQQIVTGSASLTMSASAGASQTLNSFTTTVDSPVSGSITTIQLITNASPNSNALEIQFVLVNTTTNVVYGIAGLSSGYFLYPSGSGAGSSDSNGNPQTNLTATASLATLPAGSYQLRAIRGNSAGTNVGSGTLQTTITYSITITSGISATVQAALDAITAAFQAGDTALAAQLTTLANQTLALETAITTLTTRTTAVEDALSTQGQALADLQTSLNTTNDQIRQLIAAGSNGTSGSSGSSGTDGTSTNWTEMLVPVGVSSAAGIGGAYLLNNSNRQGATATKGARPGYYD